MATLQQNLEAFAVRVANVFKEEKQKPNPVVASNGLIYNGAGLLGNNTNFSKWTFDPTDRKYGGGSFTTDVQNATISTDSIIPVNPFAKYEITFFARTQVRGNNANAYFYIAPCDADGIEIVPMNVPVLNVELAEDWTNNRMKLTQESYNAFKIFYNANKTSSASVGVISYEYTTKTGFTFRGQFSRNNLSSKYIQARSIVINDTTNEVIGFDPKNTTANKAGNKVSFSIAGAVYMYPMRVGAFPDIYASNTLLDSTIPEKWTEYKLVATLDAIITRLKPTPAAYKTNPLFTNNEECVKYATSYISIGWLLNRGTILNNIRNKTAISGVSMRQV